MQKLNTKTIAGVVGVGALFIVAGYYSFTHQEQLEGLINSYGLWGMAIYTFISFFATVVAPVSATPLIPVASATWGPLTAAILSLVGWNAGSLVAYMIARKFGYKWVERFASMQAVHDYAKLVPEKNLFISIVLMRLVIPVDILSYVLGLTTKMPIWSYTIASIIGTTPFAFVFAYTATIPPVLQAVVLISIGISLFFIYKNIHKKLHSGEFKVK